MLVDFAWHYMNFCWEGNCRVWHDTAFTCLSQLTQRGFCIATWPLLEHHKASNPLTRLLFNGNAVGDTGAVAFPELLNAVLGT